MSSYVFTAIVFLIIGLVVGAVTRFVVPGHGRGGWGFALTSGVLGSLLGGYCGLSSGYTVGPRIAWFAAVLGAFALVISYEMFRRTRIAL